MKFALRIFTLPVALGFALGTAFVPASVFAGTVPPDGSLSFVAHATAYAQENHGEVAIDPHVFVTDENAPDTNGPEGIHHIKGIRPARMADDPSMPLYTAQGDPMGVSLKHWLATSGTAQQRTDADGTRIRMHFTHAIPFAEYGVFLCKNDAAGYDLKPLHSEDGVALFTANGDGMMRITIPLEHPLADNESIVLVYHSDNIDHGDQPGTLGTEAAVQLVLSREPVTNAAPAAQAQPDSDARDGNDSDTREMRDTHPAHRAGEARDSATPTIDETTI